jgi:hypothetical protein
MFLVTCGPTACISAWPHGMCRTYTDLRVVEPGIQTVIHQVEKNYSGQVCERFSVVLPSAEAPRAVVARAHVRQHAHLYGANQLTHQHCDIISWQYLCAHIYLVELASDCAYGCSAAACRSALRSIRP